MREGEATLGAQGQSDGLQKLNATKAYREKTWSDCSIEERIERLRQHEQETRAWIEMVSRQQQVVPRHQHGTHGEILIEQHGNGGMMAGGQAGLRFDPLA
jgi:hypothetical protein